MPTISVIISTFNRSKRLKNAIKSVLNQSYGDFELIIVDDCSTDDTESVVKSFKDERIRYYKMPENFGHDGRPKNKGIKEANGKYICFLDDDDEYYEDALKVLYKYIHNTGVDMVYGDYMLFDKGKPSPGWSVAFSQAKLAEFNYITMGSVIIKREKVLKVGGFNEDVPRFKDWNLWLRLAKDGNTIIHVSIPVLKITVHKDCISNKYNDETEYDENGRYKSTFFNPADCKIYADNTILGEHQPLKVAIFTLTLDRLELTKRMYEAMNKTAGYAFDWFVLDQGSKDGTVKWLDGKCTLIKEKKNIGIAKGWEKAVAKIKSTDKYDIIIKLDNDAIMMTNNWLADMVDLFERNKMLVLSPYVEGLEDSPGGVMRQRSDGGLPYVLIGDRVLGIVPNLGGICFASTDELYEGFKFPDDIKGNKDYYLSQYAKLKGYSLMYVEEMRVNHAGQHAQVKDYI